MSYQDKVQEFKWLVVWYKYLKNKYTTVEPERKEFYKQSMIDTYKLIKNIDIYQGSEKEYNIDDLIK